MSESSKNKMQAVLNFINEYNAEYGYPPTVREICAKLNIKSTASAYYYIEKLTSEGKLSKSPNKNRAVSFKKSSSVNIPLLGVVTAGQPIFAYENYEDYYSFPAGSFRGDDLFMLRVQGTSMIDAGICDGDKVIVRKQQSAENGDIVVALLEDSATVKRFFKKENCIVLHPENETMEDIIVEDAKISRKSGRFGAQFLNFVVKRPAFHRDRWPPNQKRGPKPPAGICNTLR